MKVLFLDFDGVLNSQNYYRSMKNHQQKYSMFDERADLDPFAIGFLNQLLHDLPDLRIVVSSAWRIGRTTEQLSKLLEDVGVHPGRVIDRTKDVSERGYERGWEIQDWLDEHPEVKEFAIVDDDSDMVHLRDRFVKTSQWTGLLQEHVDALKAILTKGETK